MSVLVDTDVVSYLLKGDSRGEAYFARVTGERLFVSFMTAAELYAWAELRHWGERRRAELTRLFEERYRVLGFELDLAKEWARVVAESQQLGRPISAQDAWVAATARYYALPLLTHNVKDFESVAGLELWTVKGG